MDPRSAEARIAEVFNRYFENFGIRIQPEHVRLGVRREIRQQGWRIRFRVDPDDDAGFPSLEFYATHRMTDDRHVRIRADGRVEELDAIRELFAYRADEPGSREAAEAEYLRHNRKVAEELRAAGLYPEGDINAYLRTTGDREGEDDDG
jgi:hypothetical protein